MGYVAHLSLGVPRSELAIGEISGTRAPRRFSKKNVHPKHVQELLGHASVAITLDTYSHMLPGMGSEAADAMGKALR
jgi:integrase